VKAAGSVGPLGQE